MHLKGARDHRFFCGTLYCRRSRLYGNRSATKIQWQALASNYDGSNATAGNVRVLQEVKIRQ